MSEGMRKRPRPVTRGTVVRRAGLPICVLATGLGLGAGCGVPDSEYFGPVPTRRDRGHLRWCNSGEPESIDPATASSTVATKLLFTLFDGPTDYDKNGLPEPSLATHWDIAEDWRRFTFHLHDRGRFSTGRPITAAD